MPSEKTKGFENWTPNSAGSENKIGEKHIHMPEAIIMLMTTLLFDLLEMTTVFADGGLLSAWIINPFAVGITQTWVFLRGLRGAAILGGNVAEFFPFINAFPLRTAALLATIVIVNNPNLTKVASVARGKPVGVGAVSKTRVIARVEGPAA